MADVDSTPTISDEPLWVQTVRDVVGQPPPANYHSLTPMAKMMWLVSRAYGIDQGSAHFTDATIKKVFMPRIRYIAAHPDIVMRLQEKN